MKTVYLPLLGRTGNILFQVAYGLAWCDQNGYTLSTWPWFGEKIFNIPKAVRPNEHKPDIEWPERMYQHQNDLIYTRKQVREWFSFKPEILEKLKPVKAPEVLLDIRRGQDMIDAGLVCLGNECYWDACLKHGYGSADISWEIFPDSPTRLTEFDGNVNACGLGTTAVSIPAFYRMMTAKVHFRANSTFSWWAATLGNAKVYSPVIKGMPGGKSNQYCSNFVNGNHPVMADCPQNSDLHLAEDSLAT